MDSTLEVDRILDRWSRRDNILEKGVLILESMLQVENNLAFPVTSGSE